MKKVNILDARNNLSKLVSAAVRGEEIVIANRGRPVARLVAMADETPSHTAAAVYEWLTSNPPPRDSARSTEELERQIAQEREGWE